LALGAQTPGEDCEVVEVLYSPVDGRFEIWTCQDGKWAVRALFPHPALPIGTQIGARREGATVTIFCDGETIGDGSVEGWRYVDVPGYIGVGFLRSGGTDTLAFDDFGGGAL